VCSGARLASRRRRDADEVGAFFDRGAQLAQFGGHGGDAVGFLDAPAGDVAQRAGAVGVQAITASVMAASGMWLQSRSMALSGQAPRAAPQPIGAAVDLRAHEAGGFDEADVALDRGFAHALDFQAIWPAGACDKAPAAMK
jgi:hypothetical protein